MKFIITLLWALSTSLAMAQPSVALAGTGRATAPVNKTQGIVNRIDITQGKINLTHGPVATLGWPGMTMDFTVVDASILKGIQAGQKVEFEIVKARPGKFYISRITPLK